MFISLGGICSDKPLRKSGLLGVVGFGMIEWSSLEVWLDSLNLGDGDNLGVESDIDRLLEGDLGGVRVA